MKAVEKAMMVSVDYFYDRNIKGKSFKEIVEIIRKLQKEINELKDIAEHPDYKENIIPSELTRIYFKRSCIEIAKRELAQLGYEYEKTSNENKAELFEKNLPYIKTFKFKIDSFSKGFRTYIIETIDDKINIRTEDSAKYQILNENTNDVEINIFTKEDLIEELKVLYIGEWREIYSPERFGYVILDGVSWNLDISYSNGANSVSFSGHNSYPYNFCLLCEIFGIDDKDL